MARTWRGVVNRYTKCSDIVKSYFEYVPQLVEEFPPDVCLTYLFARVEQAHHTALYGGLLKLHKAHKEVTSGVLQGRHMKREDFKEKFVTVFAKKLPSTTQAKLTKAEKIRDQVIHGKRVSNEAKRKAIIYVLEYASEFGVYVHQVAGFNPIGSMSGFKGRLEPLDKSTTRWILLGMGFGNS